MRGSETSAEKGGESNCETPTTRLPKQQEDQKGNRGERGGGSITLLGKRAIRRGERRWMLTMKTHGVEFSIAGYVEEIIRDPKSHAFFFFFSSFFSCALYYQLLGTKTTCSASYGKEKTPSPLIHPAQGKKPSTQVPLVRDQPHTSRAK